MLEFQNIKTVLLNGMLQIVQKKFLLWVKLKIQLWTYVISDLNSEKITGSCYEKELQKINKKKKLV